MAEMTNKVHSWMGKHLLSFQKEMQDAIDARQTGLSMTDCMEAYISDWGFLWDKEDELKQIAEEMQVEYLKFLEWMADLSIKPPDVRMWQKIQQSLRPGAHA
ncbi:MAG: hypothetical protein M3Q73_01815 [bacterium]|nr:hypothetical protein [bacterium]